MRGGAGRLLLFVVVLSTILVISVASPGVAQDSGSGTITVHKFDDADRDGVQDDGEPDIAGWLIRLYRWDDSKLKKVAQGHTDSNGTVTFTGLVPGSYNVWEQRRKWWEPTTPPDMSYWRGGYYTVEDLGSDETLAVEFGNVYDRTPPPNMCIDFEKTGPQEAYPGETITYHYWVYNCGDTILGGGAHVHDPLLSDEALWSGDLEPGQVHEFDAAYTLPEDHCEGFPNHAWAIGHPPGYPAVRADDEWVVRIVCEPESATLTLDPDEATNQLPLDTSHVFTATVLDQYSQPVTGTLVSFSTDSGEFEGDGQYIEVETDTFGQAQVTVVSTVPDTTLIRAWIDEDGDDLYDEGEITDDPSTKVWEGEGPTELSVSKTADVTRDATYDWSVDKTVEPESLELAQGESAPLTYTIAVVRSIAEETYAVSGAVSAQNTGTNEAHILSVEDVLQYLDTTTNEWIELSRVTLADDEWVGIGESGEWTYSLPLSPVEEEETYRNVAYVTLANGWVGEETVSHAVEFSLPGDPTSAVDACATVTDELSSIPSGFLVSGGVQEWHACNTETYKVDRTVTNEGAEPGPYTLENVATVIEADSQESSEDEATVIIEVPTVEPVPTTLILWPDVATNMWPDEPKYRFTVTVTDQMGEPVVGISVSFSTTFGTLEPPYTPSSVQWDLAMGPQIDGSQYWEGQTNVNGVVTVDLVSSVPGVAQLRAWVDDGDDEYTPGEVTDDPSIMNWVDQTIRVYLPLVLRNY